MKVRTSSVKARRESVKRRKERRTWSSLTRIGYEDSVKMARVGAKCEKTRLGYLLIAGKAIYVVDVQMKKAAG